MGLQYVSYLRLEVEKAKGMSVNEAFLYFTSILGESEHEYGKDTLDGYTFDSGYRVISDGEGRWGVDYMVWCDSELEIEYNVPVMDITQVATQMGFIFDEDITKVKLISTTIHGGDEEIKF